MLIGGIIFAATFVATALSSMSGGGASVITIPVLLWLGAPFPLAMATQKVSSAFWVLPASYNYLKGKKVDWVFLTTFASLGLIGIYLGVLVILNIDQRTMELFVGLLILILVAYTYLKEGIGLYEHQTYPKSRKIIAYAFAVPLGFYESIFGAGNGIMFAIISFYAKGFDFIDALGYYFSVAFPWVIFSAALLISKGYFDLYIMVPATIGSVIGGYVGSKFARYKGNKFIKILFVVIGGILGLKLLLGL
ncbi:MAG: sulfite exporter TauE/SafE family protein [bacterium]|nr:sulfite exporter TauE/SafE family protein [bacterium]